MEEPPLAEQRPTEQRSRYLPRIKRAQQVPHPDHPLKELPGLPIGVGELPGLVVDAIAYTNEVGPTRGGTRSPDERRLGIWEGCSINRWVVCGRRGVSGPHIAVVVGVLVNGDGTGIGYPRSRAEESRNCEAGRCRRKLSRWVIGAGGNMTTPSDLTIRQRD